MAIPLDTLDPVVAEVGYGRLGRGGALGYDSGNILVGGRTYSSALSTHPPARLVYDLGDHHGRFTCLVALNDDVPAGRSHANFTVIVDGLRAAEALRVKAGDPPRPLAVELDGARMLELNVTTGEWPWCHAVWLEPSLAPAIDDDASRPTVITDPLQRVDITVPSALQPVERCIASVVSHGYEQWADDLLGSILAYGNCPDARLVLFSLDDSPAIAALASKYGALLVRCRPRRPPNPTSKALLYAIPHVVPAVRYLCLDADMLVLGDLSPIFSAIDACPAGSVLICGEGNDHGLPDLRTALDVAYGGGPDPPFFSRADPLGAFRLVVNDGLFAGSRDALIRVGGELATLPGVVGWVDERRDVGWRNQFAFNVALARLDAAVELDPTWNLQLHVQDVEEVASAVRPGARWRGRDVRVLHFSGWGKRRHAPLRQRLRAPADPVGQGGIGDRYGIFLSALRAWLGRQGVAGLAGSLLGTADRKGRVHDPSVFPPYAALHHLALANGCVRIIQTGSGRASRLSTACLAAAVAHREGGTVVGFDPNPAAGGDVLTLLPDQMRGCVEMRPVDCRAGMTAALAAGERYHAALLDSISTADGVWADFQLASQLVVEGGLVLVPGSCSSGSAVDRALTRIANAGWGVARLGTAEDGVPEDDRLGLAIIENRRSPARAARTTLRSADQLAQERPWATVEAPADVLAVPSMLSDRERGLLYWLARDYYSGAGRIVDGGCFLGGSTAALAAGLRDRPDPPATSVIASYDRFVVEDYTLAEFARCLPSTSIGASFRSAFDANVAALTPWVEVREGDICALGWSGEPIEILFLDVVKSWEVNDTVMAKFFPHLIPGVSILVQQDYLFGSCPWIHMTMEVVGDSFLMLDLMPNGSVVYLYQTEMADSVRRLRLRDRPAAELVELMERAIARWTGEERGLVELAGVMLTAELYGVPTARGRFEAVRAAYASSPRVQHCAHLLTQYLGS